MLFLAQRPRFSRGFVEHVEIDGSTLRHRFDDLLSISPIMSMTIEDAASWLPGLVAMPQFARLLAVTLDGQKIDDAGLLTLIDSPHVRNLRNLRYLSLDDNNLSERAIEALSATNGLPGLQFVSLARNSAPDPMMQPAGQDWVSDAGLDYSWMDFGRRLQAEHGARPWQSWLVDRHRFDTPLPEELIGGR